MSKNTTYTLKHSDEIIIFSGLTKNSFCYLPKIQNDSIGKTHIIINENNTPYIIVVKTYPGDFFNDNITTETQLNNQNAKILLYANGTQWYLL